MTITLYWGIRNYTDRLINQPLNDATSSETYNNINFNINDGVQTSLVVNTASETFPSFLTVEDTVKTYQWFVISCLKTRKGQLKLILLRDFLDEYYQSIIGLPFLCEKASDLTNVPWAKYLKTTNLNQVKTGERLLTDRTGGKGYIVGYLNKDTLTADKTITANLNANNYDYLYKGDDVNNWSYLTKNVRSDTNIKVAVNYNFETTHGIYFISTNEYYNISKTNTTALVSDNASNTYDLTYSDNVVGGTLKYSASIISDTELALDAIIAKETANLSDIEEGDYSDLDGKILAYTDTEGSVTRYKINVIKTLVSVYDNTTLSDELYLILTQYLSKKTYGATQLFRQLPTKTNHDFARITCNYIQQSVTLTPITDISVRATLKANHTRTTDSLYDVFCIPLGDFNVGYNTDPATGDGEGLDIIPEFNYQKEKILSFINQMFTDFGTNLIDIQWLPYALTRSNIYTTGALDDADNFCIIYSGTEAIGAFIWLASNQFEKHINYNYSIPQIANEVRIANEENYLKIVCPNFSTEFEINAIRNNGLHGFDVYGALKPYSPYIRLCPVFSGLYGSNFYDGRGLILGGDFSLDRINDAWTTYKLQNKNYELIFNRSIQSMDLANTYADQLANQQNISDVMNAVTGTISGTISGAQTGAMIGGGAGAVVGGVIGGGASLAGGLTDIYYNQKNRAMEKAIRDDTRQASIDNYQYQIGNIMAQPKTLTKVSTFTPDYRIYPLIEFFTCTAEDDVNLRSSIEWNGLEVNQITTLSAFKSGFVKGAILRFGSLDINSEEAGQINSELERGIYIYEYTE